MSTQALVALYLVAGLALGGLVYVRAPERGLSRAASALATVVLWPLWAPFALGPHSVPRQGPFTARITHALLHALPGDSGHGVTPVFSRVEAGEILRRVEASERWLADIEALLGARAEPADSAIATPGAGAAEPHGRICLASIAQLQAARAREHHALEELAELCELLQMQHVLSRYDSSSRVDELRDQLWARAEALSELRAVL